MRTKNINTLQTRLQCSFHKRDVKKWKPLRYQKKKRKTAIPHSEYPEQLAANHLQSPIDQDFQYVKNVKIIMLDIKTK